MALTESWSSARNVLCLRLDALGDVLMSTPAIRALKESRPGRGITLLTSRSGAAVASLVSEIDRVIVHDPPWMKSAPQRDNSEADHALVRELRAQHFDAAVIFTVYSQSPLPAALLCYLADIPLRLAHCRENPYHLLTHWAPESEPHEGTRHECRRQLDLVASVGCATADERMSLAIGARAREEVSALLTGLGVDCGRPWVAVHPGCSAPSRRYPPEHFGEVCRSLGLDYGWQIVLTGLRPEIPLVESIRALSGTPLTSLAGRMDLEQTAALLSMAPLLISNNTGPVHIAAAVGTPVVDIYALTNPQHTPWLVPNRVLSHDVPCRYCYKSICPEGHHHCLRLISPDLVVRSALELMEEVRCCRTTPEVAGAMTGGRA